MAKKNWIGAAVKKPGELHKDLGIPKDKPIPAGKLEKAASGSMGPKVAQRARFAENVKGLGKK